MIKRILSGSLLFLCCQMALAGAFFNVTSSGASAQISMILCLNGVGPLSCQNYNTNGLNLNITTTMPERTYPQAGIKLTTPGYLLTGCTMYKNGYCLFSVSHTTPAIISVIPATCQSTPDLVVFAPTAIYLNNPTGSTPNPVQQFTVNMTMCDAKGHPLIPSATNPIHLDVYGAPDGVITPTSTTTSTGVKTFTYNGASFPNNILINAWINDPSTNHAVAIGQTQLLQKNTLPCSYGTTYYDIPLSSTLPDAIKVQADVGYTNTSSLATLKPYTVDTGSLGVIVPAAELPSNANVIGPGPAGVTYYDSSGRTYTGQYYLAPVRIQTATETVMTQPMMVLAIDKAFCSGPRTAKCNEHPPTPDLHYLGVGFDRPGSTPPDSTLQNLIRTPAANAFLHLTNDRNGTNVTSGYDFYPSAGSSSSGLRLGFNSTIASGYQVVNLTPNAAVPGDFLTEYGCYGFLTTTPPVQFCGKLLLDVGIEEMFIDLPRSQWPAGTYDSDDKVPETVPRIKMSIAAGTSNQMAYTFDVVQSCPSDTGQNAVAPCYVQWEDSSKTGMISVNTGRRALYQYHYFYQGQCGQVGFEHY